MLAKFRTDQGKVREHNEDNGGIFHNDYGELCVVIADGMGGHNAGDVASFMATQCIQKYWNETEAIQSPIRAEQWLKETIEKTNESLYRYSLEHDVCQGMGTTLVVAICTEDFVTMAHVGDSRLYMYHEGTLQLKTEDHSFVQELLKAGQISKQEAENHPKKNILLRAIGTEPTVSIDIQTITWDIGHVLLLCSDGLSNKLTKEEMERLLRNSESLEETIDLFIQQANDYGGEDNITLALVQNVIAQKEEERR